MATISTRLVLIACSLLFLVPGIPNQLIEEGDVVTFEHLRCRDIERSEIVQGGTWGHFIETDEGVFYGSGSFSVSAGTDGLVIGPSGQSKESWNEEDIEISFPGSNPVSPQGRDPDPAIFNLYLGDDPTNWLEDVKAFDRITFKNIYHGIDLDIFFQK
jgi:hypothetical protein